MEKDKVSIIVPVYNAEKYLDKCINSVLNQTYKNIELILIDDVSSDNSFNKCNEYAKKDDRVKAVKNEKNLGQAGTRNKGLDLCTGDYICFLDNDDWYDKLFIETIYNNLINNNADISGCATSAYYDDSKIINSYSNIDSGLKSGKELIINILNQSKISWGTVWNKIFPRKFIKDLYFLTGTELEDYYVMLRLFHKVDRIYFDNKPMYYYLQRSTSQSKRGYHPNIFSEKIVCEKLREYFEKEKADADIIESLNNFEFNVRYSIIKYMYIDSKKIKRTELKNEICELNNKKIKIVFNKNVLKKLIILNFIKLTYYFKKYAI